MLPTWPEYYYVEEADLLPDGTLFWRQKANASHPYTIQSAGEYHVDNKVAAANRWRYRIVKVTCQYEVTKTYDKLSPNDGENPSKLD